MAAAGSGRRGRRGEARVVNHSSGARRGPSLHADDLAANGGNLGGDGFQPGPAELLPPERDPEAERLLWESSLGATGVVDFFG